MIRKLLCFWIAYLSLVLLGGCLSTASSPNDRSNAPAESSEVTIDELKPNSDWTIYHTRQGKLTDKSTFDTVFVHTRGAKDADLFADLYISAQINNDILTCNLGSWEQTVFQKGSLYLTDLDNNGTDEILLFMEITRNGGSLAQAYAVRENKIVSLCDLDVFDLELDVTFENDYVMLLENKQIGFSQAYNISKEFAADSFDENGRLKFDRNIFLYPIDVNSVIIESIGDKPIIRYNRIFKLTNRIGELQITIQYASEQGAFRCVNIKEKTDVLVNPENSDSSLS